jgi:hypothetical protein
MSTTKTHLIWWSNCSPKVKEIILQECFPEFTIDIEKLTDNNIHYIWIKHQILPNYI